MAADELEERILLELSRAQREEIERLRRWWKKRK